MNMRQTTLSVILARIAPIVGVALCVIPFFASAQAQTANGQTQLLLEMQALKQEVAQLRDMVERQQFEMRKLQRQLQGKQRPQAAAPTANGPKVIQLNNEPLAGAINSESPNPDQGLISNSVDTAPAAAIDTGQGAEVSGVVIGAESSGGREFPPVVEISVGSSEEQIGQANTDSDVAIQSSALPDGAIDAQTEILLNQQPSTAAQGSRLIVDQASNVSVPDIKPIETVSAQPVIAVPNTPQTPEASDSQAAATQTATLDPSSVVDVVSENDYYQRGFALLKESKHSEAVVVFKKQIASYPKGERADDAYYWIAESMYVNRKLDVSKENFKAIIQGYPNSSRLPDAMLKLAYIEQEQGNILEARILLQEILQFHPNSDAAVSAKNRLAELK